MNRKGFTLIELLLALFITALIITVLSIVFNTGLRAYRQGKDLLEITKKAQFVLGQVTREIKGAIVGPNITFEGNANSFYFMAPIDNASDVDLCELGYLLSGSDLQRHLDEIPYEYPANPPAYSGGNSTFCTNVTALNLQYRPVGVGSVWQPTWPSSDTALPEVVEVRITIQGNYTSKIFTTWVYLPNSTNNT